MPKIRLKLKLESTASRGAPTSAMFTVASNQLGVKARVPVKMTIKGHTFRTSLFPTGGGTHYVVINKHMRETAGVAVGDTADVAFEIDTEPRVVTLAADVKKALVKNKKAKAAFDKMAYTHQKEYVGYVEEAKRPETRAKRIEKTVEVLSGLGKKTVNG